MPRTAIIAVHGVGSPPRFETARGIADLLTQYGSLSESTCAYPSFREQLIKIPVGPLRMHGAPPRPPAAEPAEALNALVEPASPPASAGEQPGKPRKGGLLQKITPGKRDRTMHSQSDLDSANDLDVAFMRDQLHGYENSSRAKPFNTIEIVGSRQHDPKSSVTEDEVRIYEMYWADLSRFGGGLLQLLGGIYQLILHIAHLGRKTLDIAEAKAKMVAAAAQRSGDGSYSESAEEARHWKGVAFWHAMTLRFFTVAVPVCTLLLLGCVTLFLPDAMATRKRLVVAVIIAELSLLGALGAATYFQKRTKFAARALVGMILLFVAGGVATVFFAQHLGGDSFRVSALNVVTILLVLAVYFWLIKRYDSSAPGAYSWGSIALGVVIASMLALGSRFVAETRSGAGEGLRFVGFAGFQISFVLLIAAWMAIWFCTAITTIKTLRMRMFLMVVTKDREETRERAGRALWTARVTLGISLFGFCMTALVSYETVNLLAWKIHGAPTAEGVSGGFNVFPTVEAGGRLPLLFRGLQAEEAVRGENVPAAIQCEVPANRVYDPSECAKNFFDDLIAESGTVGLPLALATAGLAFLLVSWFVILVAVTSVKVPNSESKYAPNIGSWMTEGFQWLRISGTVLVAGLGIAIILGIGVAVAKLFGRDFGLLNTEQTKSVLNWLAIAVLASSATLAAARARLNLIASRARPALGILLDVDNYLRESPTNATPRAMIAERYVSLLRHVLDKKDGPKPYFDRVVIVSHSQGTVISADLLRYLTLSGADGPDISTTDVRLITMGSPLRQLYAANFPHLYSWIDRTDRYDESVVRDDDADFRARGLPEVPLTVPNSGKQVLNTLSPSPYWLRVRQWVNLYTAGDYVGRPLWQNADTEGVWDFDEYDNAAVGIGRRERCLGDGTHTRYWTSLEVAREIDDQVATPSNMTPSNA